ncbi:hypothetical protein RchiOBHm_Chr3g0487751 [Rosa chinensis]|uniref:Uncharacterized protein n=1 Tax=Rosa chinensis TaxID=74649 RepID=A0A2P6RFM3_ROSCH|nr:hypothetical protein RchiOBHm_Chr3g0487751 [Rosa chinensis]
MYLLHLLQLFPWRLRAKLITPQVCICSISSVQPLILMTVREPL